MCKKQKIIYKNDNFLFNIKWEIVFTNGKNKFQFGLKQTLTEVFYKRNHSLQDSRKISKVN